MLSIFYGANVIAMFITLLVDFRIHTFYKVVIPFLLSAISIVWLSYGTTNEMKYICLLQLVEGTVLSFLNIVLTTHLQITSKKDILGRVIGINDFINNFGKFLGIVFTYSLLTFTTPNFVFLLCAFILFAYAIYNHTIRH